MNSNSRSSLPTLPVLLGLVLTTVPWYLRRMADGSDEPLGWIALATVLVALVRIPIGPERNRWMDRGLIAIAFGTALARPWLPDLVFAAIAVGLLLTAAVRRGLPPAAVALGLLSLPVLATLDFYLGYPLRLAAGWVSAAVMRLFGTEVIVSGIRLCGEGFEVMIDRPCAGLRYLWCGWYAAAVAGLIHGLRGWRFLAFGASTTFLLFAANVLRITLLFHVERAGLVGNSVHEAIGLAVFGISLIPLFAAASRLAATRSAPSPTSSPQGLRDLRWRPVPATAILTVGIIAIAVQRPLTPAVDAGLPNHPGIAGMRPDRSLDLLGYRLVPLGSSTELPKFFESHRVRPRLFAFPGGLALLRETDRPSRGIHPADDCFRGAGYVVRPLPLWRDPWERTWRCFEAVRGYERRIVRQLVVSADGSMSFPDISQWYWQSLRLPDQVWRVWTVVLPPESNPDSV